MMGLRLALALALLGACDKKDCEDVCKRVARCRAQAREGTDVVHGEREPGPDAACMNRCANKREEFDKCEAVRTTCEGLRGCLGPL